MRGTCSSTTVCVCDALTRLMGGLAITNADPDPDPQSNADPSPNPDHSPYPSAGPPVSPIPGATWAVSYTARAVA